MSEDTPTYNTPSYLETVQSQLPALQLLTEMGWEYLPPEECNRLRGGRLGTSILDPILVDFIRQHGRYTFKGAEHIFTENAITNAVQALKAFRATGAIHQNEQVYDLLCLGTSVPQTVEGDTKSFSVAYIDWKHPENNRYHCTAEFKVERVGLQKHYIPDIVLFINGIPIGVIECKRSAYSDVKKQPIELAINQLADYQKKDGIPQVFLYAQLLFALARDKAEYGTTGTPRKYWTVWREEGLDDSIRELTARPVAHNSPLLTAPFQKSAKQFLQLHNEGHGIYEQDRALYALCRPERILRLIYQNILFDNGAKKIARYQQFFAVEDILQRIRGGDPDQARGGGVVWHTQGSGKSLTMVMLAKALVLAPDILTPKVILVTDRIDLDDQICGTFRACGFEPEQASTGQDLVKLLSDDRSHVVTTLIHKFETATKARNLKQATHDTFVLVDEGHRSNYSEHHARMRLALKGACFIAFTGTPLAKGAKRNTFQKFGALFTPPYTIARAIEDKAVVQLLYEARHVPQSVDQAPIDSWFEKLTHGLNDAQRADLKRKFSSERQLNKAEQKIRMIAWDVSLHYERGGYKGTGLKGQLVTPDKAAALLYKKCFDEFGMIRTEVLISGPNVREGEDGNERGAPAEEKVYWQQMMDRYGSEERYNKQLINAFKKGDDPEVIIVVDKLLTGFDAPSNAVLYLARPLKGHTLLQAIARVNRLFDGKEYGLILDYSGVIEELDQAIDFYAQLADFDETDLAETVHFVGEEVARLPQLLSDVWELFPGLKGTTDPEAFLKSLRDEARRDQFYERFGRFARTLSLALSSTSFLEQTPEATIQQYKRDLKFFQNLRAEAATRYQERIDFSEYEPKIQKLIDTHVGAADVVELCAPINLFDAKERQDILQDQGKSPEAKADMIASATQRAIEHEMEKDPAFFTRFSKMIQDVLDAIYEERMQAIEALPLLEDYANKVATHTDDTIPEELVSRDMARRYYGVVREEVAKYHAEPKTATQIASQIQDRLGAHKIRDFRDNPDALNRMRNEIDDVFFEVLDKTGLEIPLEVQDKLIDQCIEITIANED
ncbi:MAG: HsdR family type I site-specific deoxyribonuclease [Candidatus Latescibacteria bacterium]|nr:HsdR family type I site-specific deoxyribonuclease [Candidatus Latescibacterota bacterium]